MILLVSSRSFSFKVNKMYRKISILVFICFAIVSFAGVVICGNQTYGVTTPTIIHEEHIYVKSSMLDVKTVLLDYPSRDTVNLID